MVGFRVINSSNGVIRNCRSIGGGVGLSVEGGQGNVIEGFETFGAGSDGVSIDARSVTKLSDITSRFSGRHGVRLYDGRAVPEATGQSRIDQSEEAMKLSISGITSVDNGGDGIRLEHLKEASLSDVHVARNVGNGISVDGGRANSLVETLPQLAEIPPDVIEEAIVAYMQAKDENKKKALKRSELWEFVKKQQLVSWLTLVTGIAAVAT